MGQADPNTNRRDSPEQLLQQSRPGILAACVVFGAVAILSCGLLAYQWNLRLPSGGLFRDTELAGFHLFGHLLRTVLFGYCTVLLWKYERAVRRYARGEFMDTLPLFAAHKSLWNGIGTAAAILVVFGISYVAYAYYLATRPSIYGP